MSSPRAPFIPAANITGKHDLPRTHQISGVLVDGLVRRAARMLPRRVVADHRRDGQSEALDPAYEIPSQPLGMPSGQRGNDDLVKVSAANRVLNGLPCIRASDAARDGLTGRTPKQRNGRVKRPVGGHAIPRIGNEQREFACAGPCPATHLRKQPWRCRRAIGDHKHTDCSCGLHQRHQCPARRLPGWPSDQAPKMARSTFSKTDSSGYCGCRRSWIRSAVSLGAGRRSSHPSQRGSLTSPPQGCSSAITPPIARAALLTGISDNTPECDRASSRS